MPSQRSLSRVATFIEPMECLAVPRVPDGPEWTYEIKLDGYRLEAVCCEGKTTLYSRRQNVLNGKFPYIAKSLDGLPNGTVIDGELVALSSDGRPNFDLLQNFRSAESHIIYYAFDILVHKGHDLTQSPLAERRDILRSIIQPTEHVDLSAVADKTAAEMLASFASMAWKALSRSAPIACISRGSDQDYGPSTESASARSSLWEATFQAILVSIPWWWAFIAERISSTPPAFEQALSLQPGRKCSRESSTCRPHAVPS